MMEDGLKPRTQLLHTLANCGDVEPGSVRADTDRVLGIGREVVRLVWRGERAVAVAGSADLAATCGAVVDAVLLAEHRKETTNELPSQVNVLIHREPPSRARPSETAQALRSLRAAVAGLRVRLWYRDGSTWVEDLSEAPAFEDEERVGAWVENLLLPRLVATPTDLARALVRAVDDPSLGLYPSEIRAGSESRWSLRLDGLEIGTVGQSEGLLTVGGSASTGDGPQRTAFIQVAGGPEVRFSDTSLAGAVSVSEAADIIRQLMAHWRGHDVRGAPVTHRTKGGQVFVDEHALEARVLSGIIQSGAGLVLDDREVARGSQFPTLWGRGGNARYLDAMLVRGRSPFAVELKVATGGQGRYYRHAIVQAVLYRHFIRQAPQLDPWFQQAGLERRAVEAAIGIPRPQRRMSRFEEMLARLRSTAARFDVEVLLLEDRGGPGEWYSGDTSITLPRSHVERLSLDVAGELAARWPKDLGQLVQRHDQGGGQYDELVLLRPDDKSFGAPNTGTRVTLNREGSLWIWDRLGEPIWVWRGIWSDLAAGRTVEEAVRIVGSMAGLPSTTRPAEPTLGSLAAEVLENVGDPDGWGWECAVCPGRDDLDLDPFASVLSRYARQAPDGRIPTIARIWCALYGGEPRMIVDQSNLRFWVRTAAGPRELTAADPHERARVAIAWLDS